MKTKTITIIFFIMQCIINTLPLNANEIKERKNSNDMNTDGYAAFSVNEELKPYSFNRRQLQANDVAIEIAYCGICHSDVHYIKGDWGNIKLPAVPGHEIVGIVSDVGNKVTKYQKYDRVGVGCLIDSCKNCTKCNMNQEQFCKQKTFTYGSIDKETSEGTQGGYSNYIVVKEDFVLKIPDNLALKQAAPLLCAGITTYTPLSHYGIGNGNTVAVIGVGGLGHVAIKIAKALGAEVIAFTHSPDKESDAKRLGADEVVITYSNEDTEKYQEHFDLILDTISSSHDINPYLKYLKHDGTLVFLGISGKQISCNLRPLIAKRCGIRGSAIGGIADTQEMLNFCSKHEITADIELISADEINTAYERILKSDIKYRFVIDASTFNKQRESDMDTEL